VVLKVFSKKRSFLVQKTRTLFLLSEAILNADGRPGTLGSPSRMLAVTILLLPMGAAVGSHFECGWAARYGTLGSPSRMLAVTILLIAYGCCGYGSAVAGEE
jgi:hypothetical protein